MDIVRQFMWPGNAGPEVTVNETEMSSCYLFFYRTFVVLLREDVLSEKQGADKKRS